jgi:hypothetical protein
MEAFDEGYTPENTTVSEPTLSSFTTLGIDDCHATSIKRSEQEWLTPIPNNMSFNKTDMLDQYYCLVLPGTSEDGTNSDNKVQSKWSYCNHELL